MKLKIQILGDRIILSQNTYKKIRDNILLAHHLERYVKKLRENDEVDPYISGSSPLDTVLHMLIHKEHVPLMHDQFFSVYIADDFQLSLPTLSRMIKKETGFTFQELLMRKRFQKAVMFLIETELPVEEIAVNIGYENHSYFYRQFKARYGMTPNQYRKLHKNDETIKL